jgi:hypothetical protein
VVRREVEAGLDDPVHRKLRDDVVQGGQVDRHLAHALVRPGRAGAVDLAAEHARPLGRLHRAQLQVPGVHGLRRVGHGEPDLDVPARLLPDVGLVGRDRRGAAKHRLHPREGHEDVVVQARGERLRPDEQVGVARVDGPVVVPHVGRRADRDGRSVVERDLEGRRAGGGVPEVLLGSGSAAGGEEKGDGER